MYFSRLLTVSFAIFASSVASAAHATTVTAVGSSTVATGGTAPGSAQDYYFFGAGQSVLTNYSVTATGPTGAGFFPGDPSADYTHITAPGGSSSFFTGLTLTQTLGTTNTVLASFTTLTASDFVVYVLDANTDGNQLGNASVGLGVAGGSEVTIPSDFTSETNEFSEFLVTGVTAGEVFDVYGTAASSTDRASIGGLTFGPASNLSQTPEPSSILLSLTGLGSAIVMARRRLFS